MSHGNLMYLTTEPAARAVPRGATTRIDDLLSSAASFQEAKSYFIDKRMVFRKLMSKLVDQRVDVITALKNDVVLLIEAKARAGQKDRTLESLFHGVIEIDPKTDLSFEEIRTVTAEEHPEDFVIGGSVNQSAKTITLYRGDFSSILISFGRFEKNAAAEPDFSKFSVIDHGMALKLGDYEVSVYSILYELDPDYRKRINRQRKSEDKTFGACLFRARKIKGLNQGDFRGVRRETIVRIENRKSRLVQVSTKEAILRTLNLTEEELRNY